jgi:hypothetical protein
LAHVDITAYFKHDYFRNLKMKTYFDVIDNVKIEVNQRYFEQLVDDSLFLNCLRSQGVNNWDGWDMACEEYEETKAEEIK